MKAAKSLVWAYGGEIVTSAQRRRISKLDLHAHHLTTTAQGVTQPRQSPITDIRTLTRLVFESYQASYPHSSPKVHRRYQKLISELSGHAIQGERGHSEPQ